jgi:hypothetical protein
MWRQTSIHNALGYLDAYVDCALYDETLRAGLRTTGDPQRASAVAWATVIAAAVREAADPANTRPPCPPGLFPDRAPEPAALVDIADALATGALPHGAPEPQPVTATRSSHA